MASIHFNENGLNVRYISHFIDPVDADRFLEQLQTLPFYTPTLHLFGKDIKPKRQVLAFGDRGLSYTFSGTRVSAIPWIPLILELRDKVEKQTACTFNFVLLNFYGDGTSYISPHKDDEQSLEASFPIAVLSFGAKRKIEFQRDNTPTTCIELEHGSFYSMEHPTNQLFTHAIPPDPQNKKCRISLTFRHILQKPDVIPLKKPKLDFFNVSPPESPFKIERPLELPVNDWLEKHFQTIDPINPLQAEFNLNWGVFVQIRLENLVFLRIHIRQFKEMETGEKFATKAGVMLTPSTWGHLCDKIWNFSFDTIKSSFIANNQLMMAYLDEDFCFLQQLFHLKNNGFFLKPPGIKLSSDQVFKLNELCTLITETLIDILLTKVIPNAIINKSSKCYAHVQNESMAKEHFLNCFRKELESSVSKVCRGCQSKSQINHKCLMQDIQCQNDRNKHAALLDLNIFNLAKTVTAQCNCFHTSTFFQQFNSAFFEELLENMFH